MKKVVSLFVGFLCSFSIFAADIDWSFPAVTISIPGENSVNPQVAIDPQGNVVAIWLGKNALKTATKLAGKDWGSVTTLSDAVALDPYLVMDSNGNATAIWIANDVVYAATSSLEGPWSSPTILSYPNAENPHLAVSAAGDVVAVWSRDGNIEVATKMFRMNWSESPHVIISSQASNPHVAIGGNGPDYMVGIAWHSVNDMNVDVISAEIQSINGDPGEVVVISDPSVGCNFPDIAIDANGNAAAVWHKYNLTVPYDEGVGIQAAFLPFGSVWGSPSTLSRKGYRDPDDLIAKIAFDSLGNAVATWKMSFDDMSFSIQSAVLPVGGIWTFSADIVSDNLYTYSFDHSVDSFGNAYLVYMYYDPALSQVIIQSAASYVGGILNQIWSSPQTLSKDGVNGFPSISSSVKSSTTTNLAAAWVSYNGSNNEIKALVGSHDVVLPATNLQVTSASENFEVFTDYYNTLSWKDSLSEQILSYLIYRNNLPLGRVEPGVMQIVDHNRAVGIEDTYSITAFDKAGFQSAPAKITAKVPE